MPEQHEKTNTKISRSTNSQQHGQQQHFIVQHLLHEENQRITSLG